MSLPQHFYHPFLVHLPIAIPFICLLLFAMKKEELGTLQRELMALFSLQLICALLAFYSGAWASDSIVPKMQEEEKALLELHYVYGRLVLIGAVASLLCGTVAIIATQRRSLFFFLALSAQVALCGVVVMSGLTGGQLVHEFQVNKYFIH